MKLKHGFLFVDATNSLLASSCGFTSWLQTPRSMTVLIDSSPLSPSSISRTRHSAWPYWHQHSTNSAGVKPLTSVSPAD